MRSVATVLGGGAAQVCAGMRGVWDYQIAMDSGAERFGQDVLQLVAANRAGGVGTDGIYTHE